MAWKRPRAGALAPSLALQHLRMRCMRRSIVFAVSMAAFSALNGSLVALASSSASSSSSSGSEIELFTLERPMNDSGVARLPIALLNGSSNGFFAGVEVADNNGTITFESLLEDAVVPKYQEYTNETRNDTTVPAANGTIAERIPIEELSAATAVENALPTTKTEVASIEGAASQQPNTTTTAPTEPTHTTNNSSASSSSSAGEIAVTKTESPSPVVEAHGVPSPPTLVTAAAFDGRAEVSWRVPDDDGLDPILEYEVAWIDEIDGKVIGTKAVAAAPGSVVVRVTTSPASSSSQPDENKLVPTTATITSLVNGRSYAFKVRAKNVNGFSTWSAKSLAVSPLHPPDLCGRVSCSGHGTCFPNYQAEVSTDRRLAVTAESVSALDGHCICRAGFNPPDCSVKNDATAFVWTVTGWGECNSGCGGGQRSRSAVCWDVQLDKKAASDELCADKKPSLTRICNGIECGSKLVSVRYQVETSYDEVLFSPEAWDAFEMAFTTEVAAALQIPRTRLEITAIRRGSIVVFFQILPASRVGERSLNDIVELLQLELGNATSTLRSRGTFARRVETTCVKLSFSIADQTVAGGAEDISVVGLVGTVFVLCAFVALFGLFLRKRHERIAKSGLAHPSSPGKNVLKATRSDMKPMSIRSMA